MPVIPKQFANCAFYLYRTREDAERGVAAGGTGFLVAMRTDDNLGYHYGVTNWHVAVRDGFSVIRINTADGGVECFEFGPEDWHFEPHKNDIAIVPLSLRDPNQQTFFIGTGFFITELSTEEIQLGPGDDVFMVGRFVDLEDEHKTNVPAARFGNISTRPVKVKQPTGYKDGLSYCVDMHSRSGYSGSPVFAYRTPGSSFDWVVSGGFNTIGRPLMVLLGIHWGQFPELWPLVKADNNEESSKVEIVPDGKSVRGVSGMTCVIPAWEIQRLLDSEFFVEQRKREDLMLNRGKNTSASEPIAESHQSAQEVSRKN